MQSHPRVFRLVGGNRDLYAFRKNVGFEILNDLKDLVGSIDQVFAAALNDV
jgi:hypothetical protein